MDTFLVYLIFVAEGIKNVLVGRWMVLFGLAGASLLLAGIIYTFRKISDEGIKQWSQEDESNYTRFCPKFKKWGLTLIILSFTMGLLASAIPTAKQSAVIYIVPKIINNENMNQIPDNLAKLVNEGLKELTSMVKEEGKEATKELKEEAKKVLSDKSEGK
jgi:hypothetical protein